VAVGLSGGSRTLSTLGDLALLRAVGDVDDVLVVPPLSARRRRAICTLFVAVCPRPPVCCFEPAPPPATCAPETTRVARGDVRDVRSKGATFRRELGESPPPALCVCQMHACEQWRVDGLGMGGNKQGV
jgi:hypothetical protein